MTAIAIDDADVLVAGGFRRGTVLVRGGAVAAVAWSAGDRQALCDAATEIVRGRGTWLVPGLVSAHTHANGTLLRGTQSALPLELWSLYTIAYANACDEAAIAAAMLLHDAECIRSGITGIVDHFPPVHHAQAALAAHEASGLRVLFAVFLQDVSDYDLFSIDVPPALRGLAAVAPVDIPAYEAFFGELVATARAGSGRVRVALGPNAPQRCSPAVWSLWRRLRERYGVSVHTHALETRAQARIGQRLWPDGGMIAALDDAGLLGDGLSLAHAVHTSPGDRERLAKRGVAVSHNPLSNLTLGSGVLPLRGYLDAGVTVAIGTDASNCGGRHDVFEQMRLALTLPRIVDADFARWPDAATVLTMATTNGNRILGMGDRPAGVVAGAVADLILVRRDNTVHTMAAQTVEGFVRHAGRDAVEAVMIAGRWVLRNDRILTFDEAGMLARVTSVHARLRERTAGIIPIIDREIGPIAAQLEPWLRPF